MPHAPTHAFDGHEELPEPVRRVLDEYRGYRFQEARGGVLEIEPSLCNRVAHEIAAYSRLRGRRLFALGRVEGGDTIFFVLDDMGVVYTLTDRLEPLAADFERALPLMKMMIPVPPPLDDGLEDLGLRGAYWELT